jgi:exodeoxyribonuclease VII small subunit
VSYRQKYGIVNYKLRFQTNLSFPNAVLIAHNSALGLVRHLLSGENMTKKKTDFSHFEQSIAELEQIVQQLEQGDLSLDQALQQFERGIELSRTSQQQLQSAQQKVQLLVQEGGQDKLEPFVTSEGD